MQKRGGDKHGVVQVLVICACGAYCSDVIGGDVESGTLDLGHDQEERSHLLTDRCRCGIADHSVHQVTVARDLFGRHGVGHRAEPAFIAAERGQR